MKDPIYKSEQMVSVNWSDLKQTVKEGLEAHTPDFMGELSEHVFDVKKMEETLDKDYAFEAMSEDWKYFVTLMSVSNIQLVRVKF